MADSEPSVPRPAAAAAFAAAGHRAPRLRKPRYDGQRASFLFLAPWLLGTVFIVAFPMLLSLYLSFTEYTLLAPPTWVGFDNYIQMFTSDIRFWNAVWVTVRYVFVSVPLQLAFALLLAMVLDKGVRGLSFYRSAFYLPSLLGSSVAVAILWRQVFGLDGIVNGFLGLLGIQGLDWINDPSSAMNTLIVLNVWTFGSPMVIFLAGLRQIPVSYYEAASIDGAGRWSKFVRITLPLLSPLIFFNLVLQLIHAMQAFTPAYVVSNGKGGPADSTLFYTLYLYQEGFGSFHMGYASALAWILMIAIGIMTAVHFLASKFWVFYEE